MRPVFCAVILLAGLLLVPAGPLAIGDDDIYEEAIFSNDEDEFSDDDASDDFDDFLKDLSSDDRDDGTVQLKNNNSTSKAQNPMPKNQKTVAVPKITSAAPKTTAAASKSPQQQSQPAATEKPSFIFSDFLSGITQQFHNIEQSWIKNLQNNTYNIVSTCTTKQPVTADSSKYYSENFLKNQRLLFDDLNNYINLKRTIDDGSGKKPAIDYIKGYLAADAPQNDALGFCSKHWRDRGVTHCDIDAIVQTPCKYSLPCSIGAMFKLQENTTGQVIKLEQRDGEENMIELNSRMAGITVESCDGEYLIQSGKDSTSDPCNTAADAKDIAKLEDTAKLYNSVICGVTLFDYYIHLAQNQYFACNCNANLKEETANLQESRPLPQSVISSNACKSCPDPKHCNEAVNGLKN